MRQHVLNSALEASSRSPSPSPREPTHVEEQTALRNETISAFHTAVSTGEKDSDGDEDDLLVSREKTKDEAERDQEEYWEFLAREVGEDIGGLVTVDGAQGGGAAGTEGPVEGQVLETQEDGKKPKKKKKKAKGTEKTKEEVDHEFLMKCVR